MVGGVVALIAALLVGLFFMRRRRLHSKGKERPDLLTDEGDDGGAMRNELPQHYQPEPFMVEDPTVGRSSLGGLTAEGRRNSGLTDADGRPISVLYSESRSGTPDPSSMSTSTRKTGAPMRQMRPVNIIQHADAGPSAPHPEEEPETVELPPAYTNIRKDAPQQPPAEGTHKDVPQQPPVGTTQQPAVEAPQQTQAEANA